MKTLPIDREIRERIDAFVEEISNLVKISALEAVHEALGSEVAASRGAGVAKRGPAGAPKAIAAATDRGGKRTPEAVLKLAGEVLAYIQSHPGQRLEEIGKGVGAPTKELKLPIQKLFEQESITTKGVKRGTKYFAR